MRDRVVDLLIAGTLVLVPLLPAGPGYLGLNWPWALEGLFLAAAALGIVGCLPRPARVDRDSTAFVPVRIVRRGYASWMVAIGAATVIGLLLRIPLDPAILTVEASDLVARLARPMHQTAEPFYPLRVGLTCLEGGLAFWLLSAGLRRTAYPERRTNLALAACLFGIGLVSLMAFVQYFTRVGLLEHWLLANPGLVRANSTLDDPNALASFLVLGIGAAAGIAWWAGRGRAVLRGLAVVATVLACGALIITVSRAGWFALALSSLVVTAVPRPDLVRNHPRARAARSAARILVILLIAATLLWIVLFVALPKQPAGQLPQTPLQALTQTIDPRQPLDRILKGRLLLWRAALDYGTQDWPLGAGLGLFPALYGSYPGSNGSENTHNYFLQVFAEAGIVGLGGLAVLLGAIAVALRGDRSPEDLNASRLLAGMSLGVLAFVLTWLTGHPMLNLSMQLYFGFLLAVVLTAAGPAGDPAVARKAILHRLWIPAAAMLVSVPLVLRAGAAVEAQAETERAAGFHGWERSGATESSPGVDYRWTKGRAAMRLRVEGVVLNVPMLVSRADIAVRPVTVRVAVGGQTTEPEVFRVNGWRTLRFNLYELFGEAEWNAMRTVTLTIEVSPTVVPAEVGSSADTRELGVGVGAVVWQGAKPRAVAR